MKSDDWRPRPWAWSRIKRHLPPRPKRPFLKRKRKGGRPRAEDELAFGAILWIVRTGAAWTELPERFGRARTAQRRLQRWLRTGMLETLFGAYLYYCPRRDYLDWGEAFRLARLRRRPLWIAMLDWEHRRCAGYFPLRR